ncbi:MAG: aspartate kinase [Acidimicrobiales bacterium]|nr:aspartate kinase [Acidimicrobiales bacterium]RZV46702.1 MAG: aspartate kinase [Acidimicrobiales bacterium]
MALVVQKFGGTSVADADRIREVADHVARCRRRGDDVVLVVSAMGKETDELLRLAGQVSDDPPGREMDLLITAGERKACSLVAMALHKQGIEAASFTGSQAGFITDTNHRNAKIVEIRPERIHESIQAGMVPIVAGSQGVSSDKDVTFLGRGGSDTTAVALAHVLEADSCELYTDVSGVFTSDPRVVTGARKMAKISFDELLEMTAVGCPKPAMRSVEVAHNYRVPLHVRSAFTWEPGTWVVEEDPTMEQAIVSAIVPDTSEGKLTVCGVPDKPGIAAELFRSLAEAGVNVDMIVQNVSLAGVTDISFTVPRDQMKMAAEISSASVPADDCEVIADNDIGRVSVVGAGMKSNPGVAATMFETLAREGINIEMISTSAIRISCVVRDADVDRATQALHDSFELA